MSVSKISAIIKVQKEKEVHKHQPKFNLEAKVNSNRKNAKKKVIGFEIDIVNKSFQFHLFNFGQFF